MKENYGRWEFRVFNNTLYFKEHDYEIDLDQLDLEVAMDWLLHMIGKRWITIEDLGNLVDAFADILGRR